MKSPGFRTQFGRDLASVLTLALLAAVAGLVLNRFRSQPLPLVYASRSDRMEQAVRTIAGKPADEPMTTVPETSARKISLEEFKEAVERKEAMILDARPEVLYQLGHVPGAV